MDDGGGLRGFVAGMDGPGAGFFFAGREIGAEAEEVVGRLDEVAGTAFGDAEAFEILGALLFRQRDEFGFDIGRHDDHFAAAMADGELLHLLHPGVGVGVGQIAFGDVAGEQRGLGGEEEERLHERLFLRCHV